MLEEVFLGRGQAVTSEAVVAHFAPALRAAAGKVAGKHSASEWVENELKQPMVEALREAAQKSNATLKELGPDIQWVESYVANDKTFCVYLARDEAIIQEHAKRSGFPANKITEVRRMIDPTTATES